MADEKIVDKNKKRSIWEFIGGEELSKAQVKKRKKHNDGEVAELERKHVISENRSLYLYEPYARYERAGNPEYGRYKGYSLAGILAGLGMLFTGFASWDYTLAYIGAALALASLGYYHGHWYRKYKTDHRFEKVSGLEKKVQKPDNLESSYPPNHAGSLLDSTAEAADKDEALYVRRTHGARWTRGGNLFYLSLTEPQPRDFHRYSGVGTIGILLTGFLTAVVASDYIKGWGGMYHCFTQQAQQPLLL